MTGTVQSCILVYDSPDMTGLSGRMSKMVVLNTLCFLGLLMILFGGGAFANAKSAIHEIEGLLGIGFGLLIITLGAAAHGIVAAIHAARPTANSAAGEPHQAAE